ncbi:transposase, partial [Candidatus Aerophobetes bacterium]|nr:transposase [Candidatus Aerophobetes bacterium]
MDETDDFPIGLVPYIPQDKFKEGKLSPEFHTKIDFAVKILKEALQKGIQFGEVLIDNWYLCRRTVEFCKRKNLYWLSNLKRDDILYRKRRKGKVKKVKRHGRKRIRRYHKVKEKLTVEKLVISLPPSCFTQMIKIYK